MRRVHLAAILIAVLALSACGGGDTQTRGSEPHGHTGGSIVSTIGGFPVLDPAVDYTYEGGSAMWNVYLPLLTYARAAGPAGTQLIPGLAEALPRVSDGGRRYELRLRRGLRYADGTPVRASDFEHEVQRALTLGSPASSFFEGIVGAEDYLHADHPGQDIPGIAADDRTGRITIELQAPDGTFPYALASTTAGLVPGDTPFRNESAHPAAGSGPLRFASVEPGREYVLERNPAYRPIPGVPAAKLDRITTEVAGSPEREAEDVLRNQTDLTQDAPPGAELREARAKAAGRWREEPANYVMWLFMNTQERPFDDIRVRQAVATAVDRSAVARLLSGLFAPSCNFLPEQVPGYVPIDPCPYGDRPDVARAKDLVRQAGVEGERVRVYGPTTGQQAQIATYAAGVLDEIGLKADLRTVDPSVYYETVTNRATHAQMGVFNWVQDYPHPLNFLAQLGSDAIQATGNNNVSEIRDPQIDAELKRLKTETDAGNLAVEAATVDQRAVRQAYLVPLGDVKTTVLASDRVDLAHCGEIHPLYGIDLAALCLR